jgi:hypothetical protein
MDDLKEEIRKYKICDVDLKKTTNRLQNYKDLLKSNIIALMKAYHINECDGVKLTSKRLLPSVPMSRLNECFNDLDMANQVVVNVDIEKTVENLMIKKGYNEKIAQGVIDLLMDLNEQNIDDLIIKK